MRISDWSSDVCSSDLQAIAEEGDKYTPPAGVPTFRRMKDELGRSGRKSGGGFYDYPDGGKKHLWKGLAEHFPAKAGYDVEELKKRSEDRRGGTACVITCCFRWSPYY